MSLKHIYSVCPQKISIFLSGKIGLGMVKLGIIMREKRQVVGKYHRELLAELEKHAGKGTKHQKEREQRYIGTSKFCYTISSAVKRQILKEWLRKHLSLSFSEYVKLLNSLYQGRSYEEISLAGKLLEMVPNLRRKIRPLPLDNWLNFVEGWAEVDSICQSNFTAKELLSNWEQWRALLIKLSKDKNVHKKRASLVLLTKPARDSADIRLANLAFENIDRLKSEKDILITKAISWLLRDLIRNFREQTKSYLEVNQTILPKVAIRETRNKLLTGKKARG